MSFGQVHPKGMARVLHFEVLCRALGYDPSLLLFRRFFRLAKNGDWFTFENTKVETCLVSSMVTTLGSWKNTFFWVSESIIPFKMVWRHPDAVLNDPEPSESELNDAFLSAIRGCPSRVRPFPEHLLVLLGVSNIWAKVDRDPVLMRNGLGMHFLPYAFSSYFVCDLFSLFVFWQLCLLWTSSRVTIRPMWFLKMLRLFRVKMLL